MLNRAIRSLALSSVCTLSMVIAHLLGGGELIITWFAPFVFSSSTAIFFIKNPKEFNGPTLAALLLIFQLVGHLSFGNPKSDDRMAVAHVIALTLSFQLVRHFESIVSRVGSMFARNFTFKLIAIPQIFSQQVFSVQSFDKTSNILRSLSDRAPPLRAAA